MDKEQDKDQQQEKDKYKVILIHNDDDLELSNEERALMERLIEIEEKITSLDRVREALEREHRDSIFATDIFENVVSVLAITSVSEILAEFFGLSKEQLDNLL